ncbi:MAG TPA: TIGR03118 family protein, partial [Candidatus Sulfopaludibacter sp.]|nr:TIGR03118 family protein [Candidatus Sulfopaludibacter sp.]
VYDTNYKPVTLSGTPFVDSAVPAGYGPFNIWNLGGKLYVMWAKQDANKVGWVNGAGLGAVSTFDLNGNLLQHLATGGPLNAPWGVAIAPATFGTFAGDILVGNFGDGTINAFDPTTGNALGALMDQNGNTIVLPGLWALLQGNGGNGGDANAIYFTAGGTNQKHGWLGSIQGTPAVSASGIETAGGPAGGISSNAFISIYGANLSPITRSWTATDISGTALPKQLNGVSVTVNNKPAYVAFISPKQVDVLTPVDTTTGPVNVVVTNNGLVSAATSVTMNAFSPAFFVLKDGKSIAAIHAGGSLVGAATLYANLSTPAKPGETIAVFGTGFGTTNPGVSDGQVVTADLPLVTTPTITFNGTTAQSAYGGLVSAGVYQFNVTVPASLADGDAAVVATSGSFSSPATAIITVKH